ncbi:MAG: glycosyl hydrolase [Ignavibacteriae bacterium]|nr:glycosyl hydrolase [Ignavibacteriota bacterium]
MKKTIITSVLFFVLTVYSYSQWTYGEQPFSNAAPFLSTLGSAVQNKIPKTYMYDSLQGPSPTNTWFMNAILKEGTFPSFNYDPLKQDVGAERIYALPYIVRAMLMGDGSTNTKMFGFGYITPAYDFTSSSWTPQDSTDQINWLSDVYYYFGTSDSAGLSRGSVTKYDDLSAMFKWVNGSNYMECPVVRGMPYFTMKYQNLRPVFSCGGNAMISVNGQTLPATISGTQFKIYFAGNPNRQLYMLYSSGNITLNFAAGGTGFTCSSPYSGYLRMAYVTTQNSDPGAADSTARMQLLNAYSPYVPLTGKVSATVQGDTTKFNFNFNFTTNSGSDSLLMISMPHHQDMLTSPTSSIMKYRNVRGLMKEVYGKTWQMTEDMIPNYSWNPVNNLTNVTNTSPRWYDTLYTHLKADFDTIIGARYQIMAGNNQPTSSPYGFGKNVTKMTRVICIADELIERYQAADPTNWRKDTLINLSGIARDTVMGFITKWVDGQNLNWNPPPPSWSGGQNNKLIWDNRYGGIISYLGFIAEDNPDPNIYNFDFGNARYNDHAYHYGYVIYAAAVVARKRPDLFTANGNQYFNRIVDLCRDIGNPVTPGNPQSDPYFPMHRHKDWYDGNSWMNGIQAGGAGRDQESVSEAANAWYGMYLFGLAMNNANLKNTGKLMLASEIRNFQKYYRTFQNTDTTYTNVYNNYYIVVGNQWHSQTINKTYGNIPRFIYGVHMLPKNPFIEKMWDHSFATEVWNKVFTNNQSSTLFQDLTLFTAPFSTNNTGTISVMTYNMPVQAIANPTAAYNKFQQYRTFNGYYDDGTCKSDCFYWILTRMFASVGIQQIGIEVPAKYNLYQNYPNPFNPTATIKFDISKTAHVKLVVYDAVGRQVAELINGELKAGTYKADWNAAQFASGAYFYKLISEDFVQAKKMILVK